MKYNLEGKLFGIPFVLVVVFVAIVAPILVVVILLHNATASRLSAIEQILVQPQPIVEVEATESATPTLEPTPSVRTNELIKKVIPTSVPESSSSTR